MSDKYRELLNKKPNVFSRDKYAKPKRPTPKQSDYEVGYFSRYFAQRFDDGISSIVEIDRKQFDSWSKSVGGLKRSYYNVLRLQWKITGTLREVVDVNYHTVKQHRKGFKGLDSKLTDMTEHWRGKNQNSESVSFFEAKQLLENDNNRDGTGI